MLNTKIRGRVAAAQVLLPGLFFLASCGGGGEVSSANGTTGTTTVTVTQFPGVAEFLNIDPNNPPSYADRALPVYYDSDVRAFINTPADNPITDKGATLGRVIFYDKRLSVNDTTACSTCHQQALGFSDSKRFSMGVSTTASTTAHAMRLGNLQFYGAKTMFWDKRAKSIEELTAVPIENAIELGFDASHGGFDAVLTKMRSQRYYPELFKWAFGDDAITRTRVEQALGQFQRSLLSINSKWDTGFAQVYDATAIDKGRSKDVPGFTAEENRGRTIFFNDRGAGGFACQVCHQAPSFALSPDSRSNGLDADERRIFKSPSLKNVALSQHFMHDGRFTTLTEVVEHYNSGVKMGSALDFNLTVPNVPSTPGGLPFLSPQRLNLSDADKAALVAFLKTLTDTVLTNDSRFSDPFKK
jgi:cytochrome c peroxidase